jgi:hypothetical protein
MPPLLPRLRSDYAIPARQQRSAVFSRPQGDGYSYVASYGFSREFDEFMRQHPIVPGRGTVVGRVVSERRAIHVHDVQSDPEHTLTEAPRIGGFHTVLGVPLLREGMPIGVIILTRKKVRPFTENRIELVETFADQAVIAIENTRLFEAEQDRTRELTESLEQQTATSEVLQVISSSPGNLQPVFATMLENAVRICDAKFGNIYRWDGATPHGVPQYASRIRRGTRAFAESSESGNPYRWHDRNQNVGSRRRFGSRARLCCTRSVDRCRRRTRWRANAPRCADAEGE